MDASSGLTFGPFRLLGEISRGGMAEVQYAVQGDSREVLAIKRILPEHADKPSFRRFFAAEVELTRALHHPKTVRAVDAGEIDGVPYLAMEYIHGRALNKVLSFLSTQGKRLPVPYAVYIAIQALEGLDYVHHAMHPDGRPLEAVLCDISPSNLMLGYDGRVVLIDFGIATSQARFFEQIGMLKGKKNYMAPEQLRGLPLDKRADIFSLGICLIELITAHSLFAGKSEFEIEESIRSGKLPSFVENAPPLPPGLEERIRRAVAVDPAERYPNAGEFAAALAPFARLGKGAPVTGADLGRLLALYLVPLKEQDDRQLAAVMGRLNQTSSAAAGDAPRAAGPDEKTRVDPTEIPPPPGS